MQQTAAMVSKIDAEGAYSTLSVLQLCGLPRGMVLAPGFNHDVMPLAMETSADGSRYLLTDIRGRGWQGTIEGLDDVEMLG